MIDELQLEQLRRDVRHLKDRADILDCIKNSPTTAGYNAIGYNCIDWANQTAAKCGLGCHTSKIPGPLQGLINAIIRPNLWGPRGG